MAKCSRIGQRDTRIVIRRRVASVDAEGYPQETWEPLFPDAVWCMWVGAYGAEADANARAGEASTATINMAYTSWLTVTGECRVWREAEADDELCAYEVIGEPNVLSRREIEFRVRRVVRA